MEGKQKLCTSDTDFEKSFSEVRSAKKTENEYAEVFLPRDPFLTQD